MLHVLNARLPYSKNGPERALGEVVRLVPHPVPVLLPPQNQPCLFREARHFRDWKIVHPNKEALGSLPPLLPLHEHISLAPSLPTLSSGQLPDHKLMFVSFCCTCWCRGGAHPARLYLLTVVCECLLCLLVSGLGTPCKAVSSWTNMYLGFLHSLLMSLPANHDFLTLLSNTATHRQSHSPMAI